MNRELQEGDDPYLDLHRNLAEAFLLRFEAVVYFTPSAAEERLRLWNEGCSPWPQVTANLERIAAGHDLTGGAMINVIRRESPISQGDIKEAIRSEISKNC